MKKIAVILFAICMTFIYTNEINATSATISVTSSKSQVIVGDTVTITVKVSSSNTLGAWYFDVQGSSNLTFQSSTAGGLSVADVGNGTITTKTYTFTFKASSSGNAQVSVVNPRVLDFNTNAAMSVSPKSVTFKTLTQQELEDSYSKNNDLKSLTVEGYDITPTFDDDVLEYSLEVENGVTEVNITASKEDSTAVVSGTGKVSLNEGMNIVEIDVRAQNGSLQTYVININVKELDPINVTVDNKNYTVIRKREFFPQTSVFYTESTTLINEEEVPTVYNETIDYTLVALKDESGVTSLFRYDNGEYTKYEEVNFNQVFIIPLPFETELEGYEKTNVKINSSSVLGYIKDSYPLIYGLNLQTGEKNIYSYDESENTVQKFKVVEEENNEILLIYIIIGLGSFLTLTYLVIMVNLITKPKTKKRKKDDFLEFEQEFSKEETIVTEEIENTKEELVIEKPKSEKKKKIKEPKTEKTKEKKIKEPKKEKTKEKKLKSEKTTKEVDENLTKEKLDFFEEILPKEETEKPVKSSDDINEYIKKRKKDKFDLGQSMYDIEKINKEKK